MPLPPRQAALAQAPSLATQAPRCSRTRLWQALLTSAGQGLTGGPGYPRGPPVLSARMASPSRRQRRGALQVVSWLLGGKSATLEENTLRLACTGRGGPLAGLHWAQWSPHGPADRVPWVQGREEVCGAPFSFWDNHLAGTW